MLEAPGVEGYQSRLIWQAKLNKVLQMGGAAVRIWWIIYE